MTKVKSNPLVLEIPVSDTIKVSRKQLLEQVANLVIDNFPRRCLYRAQTMTASTIEDWKTLCNSSTNVEKTLGLLTKDELLNLVSFLPTLGLKRAVDFSESRTLGLSFSITREEKRAFVALLTASPVRNHAHVVATEVRKSEAAYLEKLAKEDSERKIKWSQDKRALLEKQASELGLCLVPKT